MVDDMDGWMDRQTDNGWTDDMDGWIKSFHQCLK